MLHLRLAEHYPVPLDLKLSIVERINEDVCNIKLSGETIGELYYFGFDTRMAIASVFKGLSGVSPPDQNK